MYDDPILKQFLIAGHELPGKDNGVDIEGLAWDAKEKRLIVGLRGPVLLGMAMLLELKVTEEFAGANGVGRLRLQRIGAHGQPFRRHFLDLDGLSVRDLCFRGNDLLVLAGPTMPIDWPVTIYRWEKARSGMDGRQRFVWQESGELGLWVRAELKDAERKHDRPEALTLWRRTRRWWSAMRLRGSASTSRRRWRSTRSCSRKRLNWGNERREARMGNIRGGNSNE